MNHPLTHEGVVMLFCLGTMFALLLALGVASIVRRASKKKTETFEPRAGKTLGL